MATPSLGFRAAPTQPKKPAPVGGFSGAPIRPAIQAPARPTQAVPGGGFSAGLPARPAQPMQPVQTAIPVQTARPAPAGRGISVAPRNLNAGMARTRRLL